MNKHVYKTPEVTLLGSTSAILAEVAARTCYDSFDKAEHSAVKYKEWRNQYEGSTYTLSSANTLYQSDLAEELAHVYHHSSIIEHVSCTFELKGVGRGVLQEIARHRIATSLSVKSTRYTMGKLLIAYTVSHGDIHLFLNLCRKFLDDMLITSNHLSDITFRNMHDMLDHYIGKDIVEFEKEILSKEQLAYFKKFTTTHKYRIGDSTLYEDLIAMKMKRNVGDNFKFIVSDIWSTDLVITFNARSLSSFLKLRDSGAAWFPIHELAKQIYAATPEAIQRLVRKPKKETDDT